MTDEELIRAISGRIAVLRLELAEAQAENRRLRARIASLEAKNTVLFLELHVIEDIPERLAALYGTEPEGTIARATDTGREWVKTPDGWQEQP